MRQVTGKPRIAIAGLGMMGRNHLRNLAARDDAVLIAVADPEAAARETALAAVPSVKAYADPSGMLEGEELDGLVVAVPTTLHFSVAMEAIRRGLHVLVEKPLASTIVDARQLIAAAHDAAVVLQTGHIERFNPVVVKLAERIRAGDLTMIHSVKTVRGGPMPDRIRDVGVAIDLATHDIDVMLHLLDERPVRVSAESSRQIHTSHEDLLYGLLHFPSGAIGLIDVNWLTPEKQRRIVVLGAEGMFEADYLRQSLTFTRGASELLPEYHGGYAAMFAGDTVSIPVEEAEPLRGELDAFISSVHGGGVAVTGEDGLVALSVAKMLLAAADEGRSISMSVPDAVTT